MMLPRELALAQLDHFASVATSDSSSVEDKAIAIRRIKAACDHPDFESVWPEAREYKTMVTASKGAAGGAGLNLKDCTDGEGAGGVWLPKWTTPVGALRGLKLAHALFVKAGYTVSTAADGTITLTPKTHEGFVCFPGWVSETVGERLMKTR